jgi:spermidine/putrescine transport system permease protein
MNTPNWLRAIGRVSLWIWAALGLLFLFTPILITVIYSFNEPTGKYNYVWNKFSLAGWTDPLKYPELTDALIFSLKIAIAVTVIATLLGTLLAMAMVKYKFRAKGVIGAILILPLTMPEVALGFSLLTLFVAVNWSRGFVTIIIAQVMFSVSYVATTVRARIRGFDWRLEEASLDLGASSLRTFRKITLPLIAPGVVAAAMLTFALSLDDFIITYLNSGLDNTFPIQIWNMKRSKIPVQINVFSTALLIISVILAITVVVGGNRRSRKLAGLNEVSGASLNS